MARVRLVAGGGDLKAPVAITASSLICCALSLLRSVVSIVATVCADGSVRGLSWADAAMAVRRRVPRDRDDAATALEPRRVQPAVHVRAVAAALGSRVLRRAPVELQ